MNSKIRNVLAVIVGVIAGSAVNMALVVAGSKIIPPPDGVDVTNVESIKDHMHLFEFRHFVVPFAAHAAGTLVGAFVAVLITASHKLKLGLLIGVLFLIFGTINVFMLPSPAWFVVVDLIGAYIPMAWIGAKLTGKA
ncbi:MAG: hypothetical protein OXN17_13940 [Candidatus Poribacteria bacterium]|nr:hypothetical protein [Candidatus Poribacteria bacterium]MDE0503027.1 hypothetical protein [Candidatus Poribacteria bacterium]